MGLFSSSSSKQKTKISTTQHNPTIGAEGGAIVLNEGSRLTMTDPGAFAAAADLALKSQEQNAASLDKAMAITANALESTADAYQTASGKASPVNLNNVALIVGILAAFGLLKKKRG